MDPYPFRGITDPNPAPDPIKCQDFFLSKVFFCEKLFVLLFMRFMLDKSLIFWEIFLDILMILVDFCGKFYKIMAYFLLPGSGSETPILWIIVFMILGRIRISYFRKRIQGFVSKLNGSVTLVL